MPRVKIHFYKLEQRLMRDVPWPNELFPIDELRSSIEQRATTGDFYFELKPNLYMGQLGSYHGPGSSYVSIYKIRHDDLPDEETRGEILPLQLADESNIAEGTHLVFFSRNVVGVQMRKGSGPSRIDTAKCLEKLLTATNRSVLLTPILRPDVMALLEDRELTNATIRVQAGHTDTLSAMSPGMSEAGRELTRTSSSTSMELTLFAGRGHGPRRAFTSRVLAMIRRVRDEDVRPEALKVSYISEEAGVQVINLLGDDITVIQDVTIPAGRRYLPAATAHQAIVDGYNEVVEQLNAALALD